MKSIALILARGGSKGIPDKNIINLKQKPLLAYSILAAKNSKVDEVWVSTDCKKIKKVAIDYGAKVLDRPKNHATDTSKSEHALIHFSENINFDIMVFIQPTSPLINSEDINSGLLMMQNSNHNYDSVFSAYKEHWLPRWSLDNKPKSWKINNRPMRQDVEKQYVENGAFYITSKEALINSRLRYSGNIGIIEMPFSRSFQVDTEDDLLIIKELINE